MGTDDCLLQVARQLFKNFAGDGHEVFVSRSGEHRLFCVGQPISLNKDTVVVREVKGRTATTDTSPLPRTMFADDFLDFHVCLDLCLR